MGGEAVLFSEDDEASEAKAVQVSAEAVVVSPQPPAPIGGDYLVQRAIDGKVDIESLKAIIDMRNQERDYQARAEYARRFSEMQKEFVPVFTRGEALDRDGKKVLYKFAKLEHITEMVSPIMARHGFAYRWTEGKGDNGDLRINFHVSGWGHEEISSVDIPIAEATSFTNKAQQRGVATTYGKRYSLINGLGIQIAGEDTDGTASIADSMRLAPELLEISQAKTKEQLRDFFTQAYKAHEGDKAGQAIIAAAKNQRKAELAEGAK